MELQTGEIHTGVDGWMVVELMYLSIMAEAKYMQGERESAVAFPMYIVMLLYITSTHRASLMFPD